MHVRGAGGKKTPLVTGKETWLKGGAVLTVVNAGTSPARLLSITTRKNDKQ